MGRGDGLHRRAALSGCAVPVHCILCPLRGVSSHATAAPVSQARLFSACALRAAADRARRDRTQRCRGGEMSGGRYVVVRLALGARAESDDAVSVLGLKPVAGGSGWATPQATDGVAGISACEFAVPIRREAEIVAVRFGFSCRANSQIETTGAKWREISTRLQQQGFRLVECPDGASSPPGMTGQARFKRTSGFSVRSTRRCR
jgi:hypothetical protein